MRSYKVPVLATFFFFSHGKYVDNILKTYPRFLRASLFHEPPRGGAKLVGGVQRACRDVARHSPSHHRSSGTTSSTARHLFFSTFRRFREIVSAKQNLVRAHKKSAYDLAPSLGDSRKHVVWLSLNLPEAYFACESIFWLPGAFADGGAVEGTKGAS